MTPGVDICGDVLEVAAETIKIKTNPPEMMREKDEGDKKKKKTEDDEVEVVTIPLKAVLVKVQVEAKYACPDNQTPVTSFGDCAEKFAF